MNDLNTALLTRLDNLETKVAFQEATIEELNQMVILLQLQSAKLSDQLRLLSERLKGAQISNIAKQSEETPPPHY